MLNRLYRYTKILILISFSLVGSNVHADDYYWIGGSGNWSDTLHWQSPNNDIPGPDDIAIFNDFSFPTNNLTVNFDIDASCLFLDFSLVSKSPIFSGTQSLTIYGDFELSEKITWNFAGTLNFETGQAGQIIDTHDKNLHSTVYFLGNGNWILEDDFITTSSIYLNNGQIYTNGNLIQCFSFYAVSSFEKTLDLSNTTFKVIGNSGVFELDQSTDFISTNSIIWLSSPNMNSQFSFRGGGHIFKKVLLDNNTRIYGSNTYSKLKLSPGYSYGFQGGQTQTFSGVLIARGCSSIIEINSFGGGNAIFSKNNGNIQISFVSLQGITASMGSGSQLIAHYSIDVSNNVNCNIIAENREMHWVNGSGIWSDTIQWSSPGIGQDGDCIPMPSDNLFFDENSFVGQDTVYVDQPDIICNNMIWSGSDKPVFTNLSATASLSIFGSLKFNQGMENLFSGNTYFLDSLGNQNVQTANVPFLGDVIFWGAGGWKVSDSLKIEGNLTFYAGSLEIIDNYLKCNTFHSDSAYNRQLSFSNTEVKILSANPQPAWSLNSTNLEFDAGTSEIVFEAYSAKMSNYEGDTIFFNDVIFKGSKNTAYLNTESTIQADFKKLEFYGNAAVNGKNTTDSLLLHPGNNLTLQSGNVQTIRKAIYPSGICTGPVLINSSNIGVPAILEGTMDTLKLEYVAIQDIATSGDAVFWALNSNDLGNNNGWDTIQSSSPGNLFWVEGTGNWSDPAHWAFTSGGIGGACIPTPMDNVYFDENSFYDVGQVVIVDQNNVFARDMDWSGAAFEPALNGEYWGDFLRIYSSLTLIPEMEFWYPAFITFESRDTNKIIQTAGIPFHNINNNIYFNGLGGEWLLQNKLDLGLSFVNQNSIVYNYGNLKTQGYPVSCFNFYSFTSGERIIELDTSLVEVMNNWDIRGYNLQIPSNSSLIKIDSGFFRHIYGDTFFYNKLLMNSDDVLQKVEITNVDSLLCSSIKFMSEGEASGVNSSVFANDVEFYENGKVNTTFTPSNAVFVIDSLTFFKTGEIYGNDTVNALSFDSIGLIHGNGYYKYSQFIQDGAIKGNNRFDTLICSAGYNYVLQEDDIQTITDSLYLLGNNCQFVNLNSSGINMAKIQKEEGSVFGEFVQMNGINATGNALYDAGYFSENINESCTGWIFHDNPDKYSLGPDTSFMAGGEIELCANGFNGNGGTTYEWINLGTGELLGTDSCIYLNQIGEVVLKVNYTDGPGCIKSDTIGLFCALGLSYTKSNISCNGFFDGYIEVNLDGQTDPVAFSWFDESNTLIADTKDLAEVPAGVYSYDFIDSDGCIALGSIELQQPANLTLDNITTSACYNSDNGSIQLLPAGGTTPYLIQWADGSSLSDRENLTPGIYSVTLTDANDCPAIFEDIEIIELDLLEFSLEGSDLTCFNDSSGAILVVNLQGGSGIYDNFYWTYNGQPFSSDQNINNLGQGIYSLIITDDNSCTANNEIIINEPEDLVTVLNAYHDESQMGFIETMINGGVPPYQYVWDNGSTASEIGPLSGGNYYVTVIDTHGCSKQAGIFVEVGFKIFAPTGFSPNGDNINDKFLLMNVGNDYKQFHLSIFDRFGEMVFETSDVNEGWNGRLNNTGEILPMEVYTWIVEITYKSRIHTLEKGNISLLR